MNLLKILLLFSWLLFTVVAFVYFTNQRLSAFDIKGSLKTETIDSLAEKLKHDFSLNIKKNGSIVHFKQPTCRCNKASQVHKDELDVIAKQNQLNVLVKEVINSSVVPATPSVAIFNSSGVLVYFGPYGEGVGCSQTQGYATTVLNNMLKGYDANLVVREAVGCYCSR